MTLFGVNKNYTDLEEWVGISLGRYTLLARVGTLHLNEEEFQESARLALTRGEELEPVIWSDHWTVLRVGEGR